MPWNDNKGGGWPPGGGGRGPWGQGPSNGGGGGGNGRGPNRPPDLDELWKRFREYLKRWFPNQAPNAVLIAAVTAGVLFLWILTGVYQIQPAEQGVVLRFGQYVDKLGSGLHVRLPYPIEVVLRPNVEAENQLHVGFIKETDDSEAPAIDISAESIMLTGDENVVDLDFDVFWKVADAEKYLFEVKDPQNTIKAVAESAMREVVGRRPLRNVLPSEVVPVAPPPVIPGVPLPTTPVIPPPAAAAVSAQNEILDEVRKVIQGTLDQYGAGVVIERVIITRIGPPADVLKAFTDVQAAVQERDRLQNEALTHASSVVPRAKGQATQITIEADAYRQRITAEALGAASRFRQIYEEYRKAPEVTRERMFLETMERIMAGTDKIVIDKGQTGAPGVVPYLPLNELQRRPAAPTQPAQR